MKQTDAIIGSVACGWLSVGLLFGWAGTAFADQAADASGAGASGIVRVDATAAPSGGSMIPGATLIERLNQALENAISGHSESGHGEDAPSGSQNALAGHDGRPVRGPVVVEMFTAQGCSSCPPADESFMRYAERPDVIALALHVDYWDYLGWEDPFAQPAFTSRQKAYARAARSRSIYTPQMVVEGAQSLIGSDVSGLDDMISQEKARPATVSLTVSGHDGRYVIDLSAPEPLDQNAVVQIVRYAPRAQVSILRGENAGMVVDYMNVVTAWHAVAEWDGRTATRLKASIEGDQPAVVIVQTSLPGKSGTLPGPILAAARLN